MRLEKYQRRKGHWIDQGKHLSDILLSGIQWVYEYTAKPCCTEL